MDVAPDEEQPDDVDMACSGVNVALHTLAAGREGRGELVRIGCEGIEEKRRRTSGLAGGSFSGHRRWDRKASSSYGQERRVDLVGRERRSLVTRTARLPAMFHLPPESLAVSAFVCRPP